MPIFGISAEKKKAISDVAQLMEECCDPNITDGNFANLCAVAKDVAGMNKLTYQDLSSVQNIAFGEKVGDSRTESLVSAALEKDAGDSYEFHSRRALMEQLKTGLLTEIQDSVTASSVGKSGGLGVFSSSSKNLIDSITTLGKDRIAKLSNSRRVEIVGKIQDRDGAITELKDKIMTQLKELDSGPAAALFTSEINKLSIEQRELIMSVLNRNVCEAMVDRLKETNALNPSTMDYQSAEDKKLFTMTQELSKAIRLARVPLTDSESGDLKVLKESNSTMLIQPGFLSKAVEFAQKCQAQFKGAEFSDEAVISQISTNDKIVKAYDSASADGKEIFLSNLKYLVQKCVNLGVAREVVSKFIAQKTTLETLKTLPLGALRGYKLDNRAGGIPVLTDGRTSNIMYAPVAPVFPELLMDKILDNNSGILDILLGNRKVISLLSVAEKGDSAQEKKQKEKKQKKRMRGLIEVVNICVKNAQDREGGPEDFATRVLNEFDKLNEADTGIGRLKELATNLTARLPSHANYSGYEVSATDGNVVYAIPMDDSDVAANFHVDLMAAIAKDSDQPADKQSTMDRREEATERIEAINFSQSGNEFDYSQHCINMLESLNLAAYGGFKSAVGLVIDSISKIGNVEGLEKDKVRSDVGEAVGYAIKNGLSEDLVTKLINQTDVNYVSKMPLKESLLMQAIRCKRTDIASLLLSGGASIDVKNAKGVTALELAQEKKQKAIEKGGDTQGLDDVIERLEGNRSTTDANRNAPAGGAGHELIHATAIITKAMARAAGDTSADADDGPPPLISSQKAEGRKPP